jgi:hypothetical protein
VTHEKRFEASLRQPVSSAFYHRLLYQLLFQFLNARGHRLAGLFPDSS